MKALKFMNALRGDKDAFVTKIKPDGSGIVYSTYLGGTQSDTGNTIAVDSGGNAYVTGFTDSPDYPTTKGVIRTKCNKVAQQVFCVEHPFAAKLSFDGDTLTLAYSTYLGGTNIDFGNDIAADAAGSAYIVGFTHSRDMPVTAEAFQNKCNAGGGGCSSTFVAKLKPAANDYVYSTYLAGMHGSVGQAIALDGHGNAYVTGFTDSRDFPTEQPFQAKAAGFKDAFVSKLKPDGSGLIYSSYLGGSKDDHGRGIAVDSSGNAYVAGDTNSTDFNTAKPMQAKNAGSSDGFVTKIGAKP
jgi:hypothetical protein